MKKLINYKQKPHRVSMPKSFRLLKSVYKNTRFEEIRIFQHG